MYRVLKVIEKTRNSIIKLVLNNNSKLMVMKSTRLGRNEVVQLSKLKHKSIIPLINYYSLNRIDNLIFPFYSKGDLFNLIQEDKVNYMVRKSVKKVLTPINYLHNLGYAHLDIKPENYMIDDNQE